MSPDAFAEGRGPDYIKDKENEIEKIAKLYRDTFNMKISTNQASLDMAKKLIYKDNTNADYAWKLFITDPNYIIKSPGNSGINVPLDRSKINYYKDANGEEHFLNLEDGDMQFIMTSLYETHADKLLKYINIAGKSLDQMNSDEKELYENLLKETGKEGYKKLVKEKTNLLKYADDMGSNFETFLYPTENGKGLTFRSYLISDEAEPLSFELSEIIPSMAVTWDELRERGMNRYRFEVVADMLELEEKGVLKTIREGIIDFDEKMKFADPTRVSDRGAIFTDKSTEVYKPRRVGLNLPFVGTEDYPDTFLGFLQKVLFDFPPDRYWHEDQRFTDLQFGERGIEFIEAVNEWDYAFRGKPRFGKVERDYFEELLGSQPSTISDKELRKILKKEYNKLKADFDEWDSNFADAMKQIPFAFESIINTQKAVMKNYGVGEGSEYYPKVLGF